MGIQLHFLKFSGEHFCLQMKLNQFNNSCFTSGDSFSGHNTLIALLRFAKLSVVIFSSSSKKSAMNH